MTKVSSFILYAVKMAKNKQKRHCIILYNICIIKKDRKKVAKIFGSFKKLPYLCGVLRKQVKNRQKKK